MRTPTIEAYVGCFCPHCATRSYIVEVHGQVQCGQCKQPLLNCSEGAPAHDPGVASSLIGAPSWRSAFARAANTPSSPPP